MIRGLLKGFGVALLSFPLAAPAAFFFQAEGQFPVLSAEISYRGDSAGASSLEEVMAATGGWVSQKERPFRGTGEPIRIWAKLEILPEQEARRIFLRAGPWERAEYFIVRDGRLVNHQTAGTLVPLGQRTTRVSMTPASFHAGLVAIDLPSRAGTTVFARLATDNRFIAVKRLQFSLWDGSQVEKGELRDRYFQGVFYGVMLLLLVHNLTLFRLNPRERSYLYYAILLVMNATVQGIMYGLTLEYVWPDHPSWDFYSMWIGLPLSFWASAQFVRHYLDTGRHFPRSDACLKWAGYGGLLLLPAFFLPFAAGKAVSLYFVLVATVLMSLIVMPLILGVTALSLRRRHPLARLFFAAMLCSGMGAFITFGAWLGFVPESEWTLNASQMGTVVTGFLLSMGLGFRMRQLQKEIADRQIAHARRASEHEREKRELVEEQARGLEARVRERTAEVVAAREKSDALLTNILPQAIIAELKATGSSEPRRHEEASILFTDFSGFTQAVSTIPAKRLVQELDEIFRAFDDIIAANGLEKIKTIGDAYMAAGGLPIPVEDHAVRCVRASLALTRFIAQRNADAAMKWGLRVGVHSGAVVAGIVGKNKYAYDVWGDTVNIASRLESAGETNRVNISAYTFESVRDFFDCEYRGKLAAKGKGEIDMYFVVRERVTD